MRMLPAIGLLIVLPLVQGAQNSANSVNSPETEIIKARNDLRHIATELTALGELGRLPPTGSQPNLLKLTYHQGKESFAANDHHSAITYFRRYLVGGSATVAKEYLSAQYMLARSYEYLGLKTQALRTYRRYIASSLTAVEAKAPDLVDALMRLLPLASSVHARDRQGLRSLFSSLAHISLPKTLAAEAIAVLGRTAAQSGNHQIAKNWLLLADKVTESPRVRAMTYYFRALIELANRNDRKAEELLGILVQMKAKEATEFVANARLSLGRLAMLNDNPKLALDYMADPLPQTTIKKDIVYERIFAAMRSNDNQLALKNAELFSKNHPNDPRTYKVKAVAALLLANNGQIDSAQNQLENAEAKLLDLNQWLQGFSADGALRRADAHILHQKLEGYATHPKDLERALGIYDRMATLNTRLTMMRTDMSKSLVMLGHQRMWQIYPYWAERSKQLEVLIHKVLTIGHRLVASERNALKKWLSPADAYTLTVNEEARTNLFNDKEKFSRNIAAWGPWIELYGKELRRRKAQQSIQNVKNQINQQLLKVAQNADSPQALKKLNVSKFRLNSLNQEFEGLTQTVSLGLINTLKDQSPHQPVRRLMAAYGNLIFEDVQIMTAYLGKTSDPGTAIMTSEWQEIWRRWESMTKSAYKELLYLGQDIDAQSSNLLSTVEGQIESHKRFARDLNALSDKLQKSMAEHTPNLMAHYDKHLSTRLAKLRKWGADIEWLRFDNSKGLSNKQKENFELDRAKLEKTSSGAEAVIR